MRVGVVIMPKRRLNEPALRYLVLAMNKEQQLIQFEFYNITSGHPVFAALRDGRPMRRALVEQLLPEFAEQLRERIAGRNTGHGLSEPPPEQFVVIGHSRFDDNYYSTRGDSVAVIGLGSWKRVMAPPSFVEFVQTILVREAVAGLCPSLRESVHLGNKGCLLDFTELLTETRQKALVGFVCDYCRDRMRTDGQPQLADVVTHLLDRAWLGRPSDPRSPAGIMANLRYDLFTTKGRAESSGEAFLSALRSEAAKQIVTIVGVVLAAVILLVLGLKAN